MSQHHRAARPLVSLCMIVKDEEESLGRCIASARRLADEVVVYDTGSTDGTVALAEALGATVVQGYWDEDFGRARNAALEACRGDWILHLDADEALEADAEFIRTHLRRSAAQLDAVLVPVENIDARDGAYSHFCTRLFRRSTCHWTGRLHEQVVRRDGRVLRVTRLDRGRILHYGYTDEVIAARDKVARNLRIAQAEVDAAEAAVDATVDMANLLFNLARAHSAAGDDEATVEGCYAARRHPDTPVRFAVLRFGAEVLLSLQRFDEAREWIDTMEAEGATPAIVAFLRGSANLFQGRPAPELADIADLDEVVDDIGRSVPGNVLRLRTAMALAVTGRWSQAVPALLEVVRQDPGTMVWSLLANAAHHAGVGVAEAVALVPDELVRRVNAQVLLAEGPAADTFGRAMVDRLGEDPRMIGFGVHLAPNLQDLEAVLWWATAVRRAGLDDQCPVLARARDASVAPVDRFMAALVAHAAFRDPAALAQLNHVVDLLDPSDEPAAAHALSELAPDLVVA